MTKQEFINRVLTVMNESNAVVSGVELIDSEMAEVEQYIAQLYPSAWRRAVKILPKNWFVNADFSNSPKVENLTDGTGYVVLPSDFYVLSSFKMHRWQQAVIEARHENEQIKAIQANEYTRGNIARPVCVISNKMHDNALTRVMYYYSLPKNLTQHQIDEAFYIPVVTAMPEATDDTMPIIDTLAEPLAHLCASSVYTYFEKYDISKTIDDRVLQMI
jgi:hypothetical protein